jgi:hypothetical protein
VGRVAEGARRAGGVSVRPACKRPLREPLLDGLRLRHLPARRLAVFVGKTLAGGSASLRRRRTGARRFRFAGLRLGARAFRSAFVTSDTSSFRLSPAAAHKSPPWGWCHHAKVGCGRSQAGCGLWVNPPAAAAPGPHFTSSPWIPAPGAGGCALDERMETVSALWLQVRFEPSRKSRVDCDIPIIVEGQRSSPPEMTAARESGEPRED